MIGNVTASSGFTSMSIYAKALIWRCLTLHHHSAFEFNACPGSQRTFQEHEQLELRVLLCSICCTYTALVQKFLYVYTWARTIKFNATSPYIWLRNDKITRVSSFSCGLSLLLAVGPRLRAFFFVKHTLMFS